MRMRKKPNLIPRMERCAAIQVKDPEAYRGAWREKIPGFSALHVEIGCGKGKFTVETAEQNPDVLFVAVERVPDAMVVAMERVMAKELTNVRFIDMDAAKICEIFADGEVDRIYLNFSDPWPQSRRAKRRLTHPNFLSLYRKVLGGGGAIHMKTDNVGLFDFSLEAFAECRWELSEVTRDLHGGGVCGVMTDFEAKFVAQGMSICRCVAVPGKAEAENE